jgi:hypothetical protein
MAGARSRGTEMRLPQSLNEVSADWLGEALAVGHPGVAITGCKPGAVIKGMATKAQFFLEYNEQGRAYGLPPSMWVKAGFEAGSARSVPLYAAEVNFFRDLAPHLPIRCPASYFQAIDPGSGNGILILEDMTLRHARFGSQFDPLTPDGAADVLDMQARYHSFLWADRAETTYPWLTVGGAIGQVDVIDEFLGFWDVALARPRYQFVGPGLQDRVRVRKGLRQMEALDKREARCLVHGDCHLGNLFFEPDGGVGLLDWQTAMRGHWAFDVSYFLTLSLSVEHRRRNERALMEHYLDRLRFYGVTPPSFDDAWLSYRQHIAWCFLTILCPVEKQAEEICMLNAERACAAMMDHDTFGALGV